MSEKIKPALTAEEWKKFHVAEQVIWEVQIIGKEGVWEPDSHAIAALALYQQPFGFTREDVKILRECEYAAGTFGATDISEEEGQVLTSIADRIEALLPEKEGA